LTSFLYHTFWELNLISHEVLHSLRFCTRIIVSITFQKVDDALNTKTGSEGDDESLQYACRSVENCRVLLWFLFCYLKMDYSLSKWAVRIRRPARRPRWTVAIV